MKFYYTIRDKTYFNYEVTDKEEMEGKGETQIVKLKRKKGSVNFDYKVQKPHNDIMAFIFIIIFYPFIKKSLTFLFPISKNFITNLKKINQFKNLTINATIKNIDKYNGRNNLIPMGGGMDSTSIMCLFKDAYLYHQKGKEKVDVELIANKLNMEQKPYSVENNIKKFIKPASFTHWISVFVGSFLIAMDKDVKNILLGTPLGGCLIKNNKFKMSKKNYNVNNNSDLYSLIKNLGISLIYPLSGCTELLSSKILVDEKVYKYAIFCDKGPNNKACNKCSKCLRKNLELYFNGTYYPINYLKNYKLDTIKKELNNSNYKHIYLYKNPSFFKDKNKNLYDELKKYKYTTSWCNKIYDKIYLQKKEKIYLETLEKLKKYAPVMDERDIFNLENYDGNNYENKKIIENFNNINEFNILVVLFGVLVCLTLIYRITKKKINLI